MKKVERESAAPPKPRGYFELFVDMFPGVVPERAFAFCRYLERTGKRFCIDFGYENAEDITWDMLEYEDCRRQNIGGKGGVIN